MAENKPKADEKEVFTIRLNDPYVLALVMILLFALILRLYYFYNTPNQPLWWDEAEYMSAAKMWAFHVPYEYNAQRPPLFQFISALFFMMGLGELSVRLLLVILPSVLLVYCIYLLGKEMYSKEAGLIAAFLSSVCWPFLFWANRTQPDFLSMSFQVLAVMYMWKHWKQNSTKDVLLAGFFSALGLYFKVSALLVPMIFIVFLLLKDRLAAIKDKYYYYYSASFLLTLVPQFIWSFIVFGNPVAFKSNYVSAVNEFPIGWYNFKFYCSMTTSGSFCGSIQELLSLLVQPESIILILFLGGVIIASRFLLYADVLSKDKRKCFDPDLFSVIALLVISAFYIFYMRNTDDRWVFLWMPFIFLLAARTCLWIYKKISAKNALAALAVVLLLVGTSGYYQVKYSSGLIDFKKDSYGPVKDASLWIKQNSQRSDNIFSVSYTQAVYYTEDNVTTYSLVPQLANATEFDKMVLADKPRYIMWSIFEAHPQYMPDWINQHYNVKKDVSVVYAKFADAQNTQPLLLIFSPDYSKYK